MQMFLDAEELRELTGHRRCDAQVKALRNLKIVFQELNGKPIVLREYILNKFGMDAKKEKIPEPFKMDLSVINAKETQTRK